jgi:hypothetical protein
VQILAVFASFGSLCELQILARFCKLFMQNSSYELNPYFCRLHEVILMLESVLFGLFVLAIMIDQLSAIFSDETAVEQVKNRRQQRVSGGSSATTTTTPHRRSKMDLMREVFGREVVLWFIPCAGLLQQQQHNSSKSKSKRIHQPHFDV